MAINTWSISAIQLWHHAVSVAKAAHQQWNHDGSCREGFANWIAFHWQLFAPLNYLSLQQQPKAKPKPKATAHSAEAGSMELDWVNADVYDPASSSGAFPTPPFAGLASVEDFASVCTFYTTYNPPFTPANKLMRMDCCHRFLTQVLPHCLLSSSWLSPEQAAFSKRIRLRVASGTSVRALLYHNIIYCKTVSRPLLSVGQLKRC